MNSIFKKISFFCLLAFLQSNIPLWGQAQTKTPNTKSRILIIFDASGSMNAQFGSTDRMTAAKEMLYKLVDSLATFPNVELALRVYGHQTDLKFNDCNDTKLEIPFAPYNHELIKKKVSTLRPRGYTPIARSLGQAANDFPQDNKSVRNIIILITDGLEECDGNPCEVSQELQKKGIFLKPFIIGVGSDPDVFRKFFSCAGNYYDANSMNEFETVVGVVISQALNATSCQINLVDGNKKPLETNVNMTIYDAVTGVELYNYYHTMNAYGVPDTLFLDPMRRYNIRVHTMPNIYKENISLIPGKHNIIALDAGQGTLKLVVDGVTRYDRLQAIIRLKGDMTTVNAQDFNTSKKYLNGEYDIEILSTPPIFVNVKITQDKTTEIKIPQPGKLNLTKTKDYVAAIYRIEGGKTIWVADIEDKKVNQVIVMQPGNYIVIGRARSETKTIYTFQKEFTVFSGRVTDFTF
ncbi:MAG: VWA domain-containing protein [Bacteroidia bacterium]|nr:VWA domain-containing protein [Bacteroidota bacterium]MCZ2130959.1 VWA domain-containing protein [Bacteroidia bacterium]